MYGVVQVDVGGVPEPVHLLLQMSIHLPARKNKYRVACTLLDNEGPVKDFRCSHWGVPPFIGTSDWCPGKRGVHISGCLYLAMASAESANTDLKGSTFYTITMIWRFLHIFMVSRVSLQ